MNFGPPLPTIFGRATMKLVERTSFRISPLGLASSNGLAAGGTPKRWRIHAACRASTEWIATAAARTALRLDQVSLALVRSDGEILEGDSGLQERLLLLRDAAEVERGSLDGRRPRQLAEGIDMGALDGTDDANRASGLPGNLPTRSVSV